MDAETQPPDTKRNWLADARATLAAVPQAPVFGVLLLAWALLFHFLGNANLGYVGTSSLYGWMSYAYDMRQDDFHGYIVPYVVMGLLWWKRAELAAVQKRAWWPALILVGLALALHLVGFMVQQARISLVGLYAGVWALAGVVWGPAFMRRTFFPLFLLAFCLPLASMTDTLTFPLRLMATTVTAKFCQWFLSINVHQVGTTLFDPAGKYQYDVAAACSGIRSLTAIAALTAGYAFVFFTRTWKRLAVVALAIPLAIFSNVLRLLMIVIASEAGSAKTGHFVHENEYISLLPYVVAFVGVLLAGRWLKEDRQVDIVEVVLPAGVSLAVYFILQKVFHIERPFGLPGGPGPVVIMAPALIVAAVMFAGLRRTPLPRGVWITAGAGLLLMAVSAGALIDRKASQRLSTPGVKVVNEPIYAATETNRYLVSSNSVFLPPDVLAYRSEELPLSPTVCDWLPKDTTYGQRRYVGRDNFWLDNMVVLMGTDRTSIHNPRYCISGQGYQIRSEEGDTIRVLRPVPYDLPVRKMTFTATKRLPGGEIETRTGIFVYWFVSDLEVTADHGQRMWQMAEKLMKTGVLTRWAYVICMTVVPPGPESEAEGYRRLKEFISASVPEYQTTAGPAAAPYSGAGPGK
jgi:exosortase